ncbi:MAG TPA: glycosidase [bacterium (Candidatus Stahlbacteria)]|nr:glycosidase [Candidatus Stahlbacteria bacterium]
MLKRFEGNPVLAPIPDHSWEAYMVYNVAAIFEAGKVFILYRAQGTKSGPSRIGCAISRDGFHIDERLPNPIFEPRTDSDIELFGCEDPRLSRIGDRIYMCYTAYGLMDRMDRETRTIQIGITSISVDDFVNKRWNWGERIYPLPRVNNKDAALLPEKVDGKFILYHRIPPHIWIGFSDDLRTFYDMRIIMMPEAEWESFKIGAAGPPMRVDDGWLFIYHGVDRRLFYRLGAALLDLNDPTRVIRRSRTPILEPINEYEKAGAVPNVTFSCGSIIIGDELLVYYGGADTVTGVASIKVRDLIDRLEKVA